MSDVLVVEMDGVKVGFNNQGHFSTSDKEMIKKIGKNFGKVVLTPEPFIASLNGWGIVYLCALIDPDFVVLEKDDSIDMGDIEQIREVVRS